MTKKRLVLYPKSDISGDGNIVAICYTTFLQEEYILYTVRSYSKFYHIEVLDAREIRIDIPYNDVELRRVCRKIYKKKDKGILSSTQSTKIKLLFVCSMVEKSCHI